MFKFILLRGFVTVLFAHWSVPISFEYILISEVRCVFSFKLSMVNLKSKHRNWHKGVRCVMAWMWAHCQ